MAQVQAGKRVGFVDLALENFHANVYLAKFRNELKDRGFQVAGCTAVQEGAGREWAAKNAVPYYATVAEMSAHVDHYVVLAPSNPEAHLGLCQQVFPFGKPTYVDKTFAPDIRTARRIFAMADRHHVPMQTTSALRYTNVQDYVREAGGREAVRHMVTWGGGGSFEEYSVHPLELVISCMGPAVSSVMRRGPLTQAQLLLNFTEDRTAVVNVYVKTNTPFAASVTTAKETKLIAVDGTRIFLNMAAAMLDLFDSASPNIPREESLMIRRIQDAVTSPRATRGFVRL